MVRSGYTGVTEKIIDVKFALMAECFHKCRVFFCLISLFFLLNSCGSNTENQQKDTIDSGTIYISADESFKPVIDSEIQVFQALHRDARIIPFYKPEADCIKDLAIDSIRMVIITRRLTQQEENFIVDSFKLGPQSLILAKDAVAVIVNPSSPDSLFTMGELVQILTGRFKKNLIPIFDGTHATSTVHFIIDSVLHGDTLTSKTMAAKTSEGVIDYVSKNPDAIGFIGISWVGNHDDTTQQSFLKRIKMASLESTDIPGHYVLAWQANIYAGRYPMTRDLVYILKEKYTGLGKGFANFLSGEQGQLIFKRAYLVPMQMNFNIRVTKLNE
ncbi:MAG: phosphate ABC transporter substrate-binding protein, PhoT family [Bacteroidetes bacterium]|nr:MAG: phosphate ABC transporter substrate-binding protein, PhoT family [Bacteroidota bacterium]